MTPTTSFGNISVVNCDCLELLRVLPDKAFSLAIVDPPYGRREHGGKNRDGFATQKNGARIFVKAGDYPQKCWDITPPTEEYFAELVRVSKHQIIWGINYMPVHFPGGRIVWDKCNQGSDQSDCEIAYCSFNNRVDLFRYMWRGMFQGKNILEGHIQEGNKALNEKRYHPTQKPVLLYKWLLQKYAKEGDTILDTHLGSGSIAIACNDMGYSLVGCEIDTDYYTIVCERIKKHLQQGLIF